MNCEQCGLGFMPTTKARESRGAQRFCSRACYLVARWGPVAAAKPCARCGEPFKAKSRTRTFCSFACRCEAQRGQPKPDRRRRATVLCAFCSAAFERRLSMVRGKSFCSLACQSKWQSANVRGLGHPRWAGGAPRGGYGGGWSNKRRAALKRTGNACERCAAAGRLDVHHKIPVRRFLTHADAHVETNLIVLCRSCHEEAHREIRALNAHLPKPSKSGPAGAAASAAVIAPSLAPMAVLT